MNARIILHDRAAKINNDGSITEISVKDKHIPINITNGVGPKGDDGNGIVSIQKTETTGLTDTYVITYTNGDTEEFTIENGNGIAGIEKTGTDGLTDTYQITYTDPNKEAYIFTVRNGERGDKGDSPEKGVDYWTEEDKAELAQEASELIDLTPYAKKTEVPVEYGIHGSIKTKDFLDVNGDISHQTSSNYGSFAEGRNTIANGQYSHAEGSTTVSQGYASHSEGHKTKSIGHYSHAEGYEAYANKSTSHAEGRSTTADSSYQHVQGKYNISDNNSSYADIVGNGTADNSRSNAFALTWTGDGKYAGDVYVHSESDSSGGNKLATEGYVDDAISHINTMSIHICTAEEYDSTTGIPTVENPDASTFYLVPGGDAPNLYIEWVYINDAWEKFGSATIDLSNYVQKTDYASGVDAGVIRVNSDYGLANVSKMDVTTGETIIYTAVMEASKTDIKDGTDRYRIISSRRVPNATFYGLAKAAGDTTQSQSDNAVGQYTDEAKAAIQTMLDVPAKSDIPENVSELNNDAGYLTEHQDLSDYALNENVVVVPGTGVGSVKTRDFENGGVTYSVESSGLASFAEGNMTIATGSCAHAEGSRSLASGQMSHAEGASTKSLNRTTHAEGYRTIASGYYSHSENYGSIAQGQGAHAEGALTAAYGDYSHVEGAGYNLLIKLTSTDDPLVYNYVSDSSELYLKPSRVLYFNNLCALIRTVDKDNKTITVNSTLGSELNQENVQLYMTAAVSGGCHVEGRGTMAHDQFQHVQGKYNSEEVVNYADIVGNGEDEDNRSNAFALTWTGDGRYAGDIYVGCDPDSTGGTKLAKVTDIPEVPVQDVQVNGTSILNDGVANVPMASTSNAGVIKTANDTVSDAMSHGGTVLLNDTLLVVGGSFDSIKAGSDLAAVVSAARQHNSVFYGLAKAAGVDMKDSNNQFGVYTDEAKLAIRTMLGLDDTSIVDIVQAGLPAAEGVAW